MEKYSGNLPHSLPTACTGKRTLPRSPVVSVFFLSPLPRKIFETGVFRKSEHRMCERRQSRLLHMITECRKPGAQKSAALRTVTNKSDGKRNGKENPF
jgi:hypothetical protein